MLHASELIYVRLVIHDLGKLVLGEPGQCAPAAADLDRSGGVGRRRGRHWLFVEPLSTQDVFRIWSDRRYVICWEGRGWGKKEEATTTQH